MHSCGGASRPLNAYGKSKARKGFVATTRRRAELRKLISRFGSNRKAYFSIIASNGLDKEHDDTARSLIGMIHADIERSRQEGQGTYHGASSAILESLLNSTSLLSPGEPLPDYTRYILSLPLLGSRLEAFNAIAPSGMQISRPPSRSINTHARSKELPPVRITKKGTLFVDESIIQKLLAEGSKLDGLTHFVRPRSHPSLNCYLLIPGNNCILLTSSIHADPTSPRGSVQMCQEILSAPDSELPEMLWEDRICLLHREKHVKADRSGVAHLIKTINQEFKQSCTMDQGGRRYKRVHSGIRITLDGDNSSK